MTGYLLFGLIVAAFAAPPLALASLADALGRVPAPPSPVTVVIAPDTAEAAEARRAAARLMAEWLAEADPSAPRWQR
jgi:hypothetical protein